MPSQELHSGRFLLREIFIKTMVDGGNNVLKDALFLLDERVWHIVWSCVNLCLEQHFSLTNVDQYDFPQLSQGVVLKDGTMPPVVIASRCLEAAPGKFESKRFCSAKRVITRCYVTYFHIFVVLYMKEPSHANSSAPLFR